MIAAHVPNLMDRSRFGGVAVRFVDRATDAAEAACVLVDLDRCDDIASFAALDARTVGFCAHVDGERMREASAAGFGEVMARSAFFRQLPSLLADVSAGRTGPEGSDDSVAG